VEAADNDNNNVSSGNDFKAGSHYLGKRHHPAIGVRIPEIFIPGIMASLLKHNCASSLMLSFGRETAPEEIIIAPPGRYEITLGHTGTSIRKYLISCSRAARSSGITVEMEADHLIITASSAQAVKRIEGVKTPVLVGEAALEHSMRYNVQAIEEAVSTGVIRAFTVDTSDLFDYQAEKLKGVALARAFREAYSENDQERILKTYFGKHRFKGADGKPVRMEIKTAKLKALAVKYKRSLDVTERLFKEINSRMKHPFAFEISLDETAKPTQPADLFFYLGEWNARGLPCEYVAPNIGFEKRQDYTGNMDMLKNRARSAHAIAAQYDALLSIHSGSGTTPYSGKGNGVYDILLECTGSQLKYKISGVYYELLIEVLAGHKKGTDARILFELIFADVMEFLKNETETKGPLYSKVLARMMDGATATRKKDYDPRNDAFRYHSFLALNFRDLKGRRYFRDRLIRLYNEDLKLRKQVDQEVENLTSRLIEGLKFQNNH